LATVGQLQEVLPAEGLVCNIALRVLATIGHLQVAHKQMAVSLPALSAGRAIFPRNIIVNLLVLISVSG
jgi:hypothetical protein